MALEFTISVRGACAVVAITKYRQEQKDGKIYIRSEEVSTCPICHSTLNVIGSRERKSIGTDGEQQVFIIRRLRCTDEGCRSIHHELPDIFVPYKRHCTETIEQAISGGERASTLEQSTVRKIRNWWESVSQYFHNILRALEARYGVNFSEVIKTSEIVRAVVNSNLWIHTRSVRMTE